MCIVSIVLIQCTPTRHTFHTQHFITIIHKATFWLHETAIAISFQVSEISEEIPIAVGTHTTVKTYGRDFVVTLNICTCFNYKFIM